MSIYGKCPACDSETRNYLCTKCLDWENELLEDIANAVVEQNKKESLPDTIMDPVREWQKCRAKLEERKEATG